MMSHGHGGVLLRDVLALAGGQRLKGLRIVDGIRILDSSQLPSILLFTQKRTHCLYGMVPYNPKYV